MIPGSATIEGTRRFADRSKAAAGHFRQTSNLSLSSIGVGTYLGKEDKQTDEGYEACVELALASGVNVFDSAINYRGQKSERAIGRALARAIEQGGHCLAPGYLEDQIDRSRQNLGLATI